MVELSKPVMLKASVLRGQHALSFWDSLIGASALATDATVLYSEDMQDGLVVEDRVRIRTPFKEPPQATAPPEGGST